MRILFHRLVVAQETDHDINLEDLLCHELSKTPLAIAKANGNLYFSSTKAGLSQILAASATFENLPQSHMKTASIIDG